MPTINGTNLSDSLSVPFFSSNLPYIINGFDGNDMITGGTGDNTINGGSGNDTINGGFGNDTINGGSGNDTIMSRGGDSTINGGSGNDTITGSIGYDSLLGGEGDDSFIGGFGNDTINGGSGNDTISGDFGNGGILFDRNVGGTDVLTGGSGNDVFNFNFVSESQPGLLRDVITDFVGNGNLLGDQIDLSTIDANSTIDGNQAFTFIGANQFTASGQVRYVEGILQANINANLGADFEIQLAGAPQLVASDIIL